MATITEDYVSFEIAKLLKEKGLKVDDETCRRWAVNKQLYEEEGHFNESNAAGDYIPIPTIQVAMKWLREVHKLGVFPSTYENIVGSNTSHVYGTAIINLNTYKLMTSDYMARDTYNEACEAAIKYCLENLI